ncbi:MAG: hypothetical protein LIV24_09575 [Eubacterium sp.]|nr:hypothetical protein [Eubacterium sp.]
MRFTGIRHRLAIGFLATTMLVTTAGCSLPNSIENTTVSVGEEGNVTENIVEAKDDDDYTEDDLKQYIEDAVTSYDSESKGAVKLESCSVDDNSVSIKMSYASMSDYSSFNNVKAFLGTLAEAEEAGFSMDQNFLDMYGNAADPDILSARAKEWKVLILSEPVMVRLPDKILYATDNVSITGRLTATINTVLSSDSSTEGQNLISGTQSVSPASVQSGSDTQSGSSVQSSSDTQGSADVKSGSDTQSESDTQAEIAKQEKEKNLSRYVTVSDRYAYIIYK